MKHDRIKEEKTTLYLFVSRTQSDRDDVQSRRLLLKPHYLQSTWPKPEGFFFNISFSHESLLSVFLYEIQVQIKQKIVIFTSM